MLKTVFELYMAVVESWMLSPVSRAFDDVGDRESNILSEVSCMSLYADWLPYPDAQAGRSRTTSRQ
jgi:hypothetical protein